MQLGDRVRLKNPPEEHVDFLVGRIGLVVGLYATKDCFDVEFRTQDGSEPLAVLCVDRSQIEKVD